jgi:hypothetical protein
LQVIGQLIGPPVQLLVGQLLVLKNHCNGIWRLFYLSFKEYVNALSPRMLNLGVIPFDEQLVLFGFG